MDRFIQARLRRESPGCKLCGAGQDALYDKGLHIMALHVIQRRTLWAVVDNKDVHDRERYMDMRAPIY
eukprot:6614574-Karenia_brevis.AAC.1